MVLSSTFCYLLYANRFFIQEVVSQKLTHAKNKETRKLDEPCVHESGGEKRATFQSSPNGLITSPIPTEIRWGVAIKRHFSTRRGARQIKFLVPDSQPSAQPQKVGNTTANKHNN